MPMPMASLVLHLRWLIWFLVKMVAQLRIQAGDLKGAGDQVGAVDLKRDQVGALDLQRDQIGAGDLQVVLTVAITKVRQQARAKMYIYI